MRIAVDIDDVLLDFVNSFLKFHNKEYGSRMKKEDVYTFDFAKILGVPRKEVERRFLEFYKTDLFRSIKPIECAVEGIILLHEKGHELITVSSRPEIIRKATIEQIVEQFPILPKDMYFSNHLYIEGNGSSKAKLCAELGVLLLIEDCFEYAIDVKKKGTDVILFDQPWNQYEKINGIYRVGSWEKKNWWPEAVDYILHKYPLLKPQPF